MQSIKSAWHGAALGVLLGIGAGFLAGNASATTDSFDSLMAAAMSRMDRDMMVSPTGDPDHDFVAMMIPHHQGAVDMAKVELRYGRDQVLRRLAQGIIVEQQQEIVVMHQALAPLPPQTAPRATAPIAMPSMQNSPTKDR